MQLNDTTLTLNSSVQEVHGVELYKDQTGVTAKVSLTDYNTSVFFDGNTAHISVTSTKTKVLKRSTRGQRLVAPRSDFTLVLSRNWCHRISAGFVRQLQQAFE